MTRMVRLYQKSSGFREIYHFVLVEIVGFKPQRGFGSQPKVGVSLPWVMRAEKNANPNGVAA